jgi:hypothetical protein
MAANLPGLTALVDRFRAFALPGGAEAARDARGVRLTQRGELVPAPGKRAIRFTAEQTIDGLRSEFRWVATVRAGPLKLLTATDAYQDGRGSLVLRAGGIVPVSRGEGPDFDRGELQRYLGEIVFCPTSLLRHPSLEWEAVGPDTVRVRDRAGPDGATVDLTLDEGRGVVTCRADRPRAVRKGSVVTPWLVVCDVPWFWSCGVRTPTRVAVTWQLPEGPFTYFRCEVTSVALLR